MALSRNCLPVLRQAETAVKTSRRMAFASCAFNPKRDAADKAGVADRVTFEVASAKDFPGNNYDLVTFFDCLHDMGDPVGASAHVRGSLKPGGTWMIVDAPWPQPTSATRAPRCSLSSTPSSAGIQELTRFAA